LQIGEIDRVTMVGRVFGGLLYSSERRELEGHIVIFGTELSSRPGRRNEIRGSERVVRDFERRCLKALQRHSVYRPVSERGGIVFVVVDRVERRRGERVVVQILSGRIAVRWRLELATELDPGNRTRI